jgi:hypothetical protein
MCFINRIKGQSAPLFQTACAPDGIDCDQSTICLHGRSVIRRERFPWVWAVIAVPAFAMTTEIASAHDKGCDGNPVPVAIKLDCCGKADEHRLAPEQIRRGPNDEYIVSFKDYTFVIPARRHCPATITAAISSSKTCG